ncbi:Site-specific recombinase XerD [Fodinibius roseus]|uniref:Site-specific recombinase XerD n=1 Tax=Fodinibius roseus TaxID=1194090 RepID=A0A1M5JPV3_9BACT|nr:site-specific integrase [Fodinibius roseus]SHG42320.1 Site-specific recombinase XerD [Fodinibius roseus]
MPKRKLTHSFITNLDEPKKRTDYADTLVKGLVLRITPTGYKSFCFRYGAKGKRYTIGKFPTIGLADARSISKDLRIEVAQGNDPQAEKIKKRERGDSESFRELTEEFKDKHLPTLRESTSYEYERIIDKELIPVLGKYGIDEITKDRIRNLLDQKAYEDESPTMANRIRARLSKIYSFGIERGLVNQNPVQNISTYDSGRNKRERFYNKKELKKLWKAFNNEDEPIRSLFKILLLCGQRKGETSRMKWEDINDGIWTIPASESKSKRTHDIPLSNCANEIIEKIRPLTGRSSYVFKSPRMDDDPIQWFRRAVKRIRKKSKVKDFRIHDLRRTAATHMAKLKVDRTVLGKILNHKGLSGDTQITAIYDRHSYLDEKREALQQWASHLKKIISEQDN